MSQDFADLMEEPPGGHNHGRRRGAEGGWASLDDREQAARVDGFWIEDVPKYVRLTNRPFETIRHGTISAYNNQRCRCGPCRLSMAQYRRKRRSVQSE